MSITGTVGEPITLWRLIDTYVNHRRLTGEINPASARRVRDALYRFARVVGPDLPARRLSRAHVEKWRRTRDGRRANTRRVEQSHLRTFCRWAVTDGYLRADPTAHLPRVRLPRPVPRALDRAPIEQTLAHADTRMRLVLMFMWRMGLRCCEVASIEAGDIDASGVLLVRGKGAHERLLPIPETVREALDDYLTEHPAGPGPLIRSYTHPERGLSPQYLSAQVAEVMREAGVKRAARDPYSAHKLRHTLARDLLDADQDIRLVQSVLGHAYLSTTAIYTSHAHALGPIRRALDSLGDGR